MPCNLEGVMPKSVYFQNLYKNYDIVCIQEHWCWDFQSHELSKLATGKDCFIRCSDQNDPITGFRLPRGKGWLAYSMAPVQAGGETMVDVLTEICNRIRRTGEWPTPWTQSLIIALPKKGNLQLCQNYQPHQSFEQSHVVGHLE